MGSFIFYIFFLVDMGRSSFLFSGKLQRFFFSHSLQQMNKGGGHTLKTVRMERTLRKHTIPYMRVCISDVLYGIFFQLLLL